MSEKMETFQESINSLCKYLLLLGISDLNFNHLTNFNINFNSFCYWYTSPDKSETSQYNEPYKITFKGNKQTITYMGINFNFS